MTGTGVQGSVLTSSDSNWNSGQQYGLLVAGIVDPFSRRIAKSTFEMTIFQLEPLLK